GLEPAAIARRLVVRGSDANLPGKIAPAAPRELVEHGLEAATGIEHVVDQQEVVIGAELRNQIVDAAYAHLARLPLAAHVSGHANGNVIAMDAVVFEHFLHRNADGCTAPPDAHQE